MAVSVSAMLTLPRPLPSSQCLGWGMRHPHGRYLGAACTILTEPIPPARLLVYIPPVEASERQAPGLCDLLLFVQHLVPGTKWVPQNIC